jgi:hypothetical protein
MSFNESLKDKEEQSNDEEIPCKLFQVQYVCFKSDNPHSFKF